MTDVAVLGAGAGGAAACVELIGHGHRVALWNRAERTLEAFSARGGVPYSGVLGEGLARPSVITTDLARALEGADVAVVCLPALVHGALFTDLARLGWSGPTVLNPGHTGGALHLRAKFAGVAVEAPPVAELSTLTYICRRSPEGTVRIGAVASRVSAAALPGGDEALRLACELFACAEPVRDVLATSLSNVNMVLHPPGAILSAGWVEATGGDFTFYVEAMTPGTVRVIEAVDRERRGVAAAFGHHLPPLAEEMAAVGTANAEAAARGDTRSAIMADGPNSVIAAPDSLLHRYYVEDFAYGLVPFRALAAAAEEEAPVVDALLTVGATLTGRDFEREGLGAPQLGIAGLARDELLRLVGGGARLDATRPAA